VAGKAPQLEKRPAVQGQQAPAPQPVEKVVQRLSQGLVQKCQHAAECRPVEVERQLEQDQPGQGQGQGQSVE
jgi:hypothetical protein